MLNFGREYKTLNTYVRNKNNIMTNYKVSVVIPVFKVEKFISRCAINLFEQTLSEVEFIFVDDASPDNSIQLLEGIIQQYPNRIQSTKIIKHERNQGLPSARNTGLALATGDFVFHCDSDDWLDKVALELLYNKAIEDEVDIVWCDWYLSFKDNERYMSQEVDNYHGVVSGKEVLKLILSGRLKYNVWNKLVKRNLYKDYDIRFPDGFGMGEDMTMIKLFVYTNRVSYLPKSLYHYVQLNNEAFTKKTTPNHLNQIKHNVDDVLFFLKVHFADELYKEIQFFKLNIKLPFLISSAKESYDRWNLWYPESNDFIDENPFFNYRTRLIQKAALSRQYWFLRLYYFLVIRVVYGVIYK